MKRALLCGFLLAACGGSDAPSATVTGAAPAELSPGDDAADDLTIELDYSDGDGDLGTGVARVHDCRTDGLVTEVPLPSLAPPDVVDDGAAISGTLELHVNDIGALAPGAAPAACRDLGVSDAGALQAVFCVILIDAAGNEGDGDCTQAIALTE